MQVLGTITSKRQLTIPSNIFEKANLSVGDKVLIEEKNGELHIKRALDLLQEISGSVDIPDNLKGINIDDAIRDSKASYFGNNK